MKEAKYKAIKCEHESVVPGEIKYKWQFRQTDKNIFFDAETTEDRKFDVDRLYTLPELEKAFGIISEKHPCQLDNVPIQVEASSPVQEKQRSYLTNAEAFSWGEFLQSDFRKLLKQREARAKLAEGMVDFVPWTFTFRNVTKDDMKLWKLLYFEHGIRNFNNIAPILEVWTYGNQ